MKITDMPNDLLRKIMGNASIADLLTMRHTCRAFRDAVHDKDVWEGAYKRHPWADPIKERIGSPEALCRYRFKAEQEKKRLVKAEHRTLNWSIAASHRIPGGGRGGLNASMHGQPSIVSSMFFRIKHLEDREKAYQLSENGIKPKKY